MTPVLLVQLERKLKPTRPPPQAHPSYTGRKKQSQPGHHYRTAVNQPTQTQRRSKKYLLAANLVQGADRERENQFRRFDVVGHIVHADRIVVGQNDDVVRRRVPDRLHNRHIIVREEKRVAHLYQTAAHLAARHAVSTAAAAASPAATTATTNPSRAPATQHVTVVASRQLQNRQRVCAYVNVQVTKREQESI